MNTKPAASDLEAHLGYWLRFVSNHVSYRFQRLVEAKGVTVSEWVVLRRMYGSEEIAAGALVKSIGMSKGAISKLVERLHRKKLLSRVVDTGDRRHHALRLTGAGAALVPELAKLADENDARFFGHLPKAARRQLLQSMQAIVRHHHLNAVPID
jgi:DNA-binding MarR family transcriptional regulator